VSGREQLEPESFEAPEPVQWHEGMLLAPQHFQLEARRIEALVAETARAATPFLWGVRRLEIDAAALMAGRFRVLALDALFGDGLILSWPQPGCAPLELDLKALGRDLSAAPATIHVAVAARSDRSAAPGALRRWLSVEGPPALDENTGENPTPAPRLRPSPALAATDGPLLAPGSAYVSLPLARVALADGRFQTLDYQPPLLRATRRDPVHRVAATVALTLREKAATTADRLRAAGRGGGADAAALGAALGCLVAPLPRLEALLRDEAGSPYLLYLALCDALGAAAGVDPELAPPSAPDYVHADALPAFEALAGLILPALAKLRPGRRMVAFARLEGGVFALDPEAAALADPFELVLRPQPGGRPEATLDWALSAIVATADAMPGARLARVRGAGREALEGAAALDAAAPANSCAVRVERDRAFVTPGQRLEIRHAGGPEAPGAPADIWLALPPEAPGAEPVA
jgi:type VI secretion system protein ImpJ